MTDQHLIPLEKLNLSVRAYNCLKSAQVNSVSDLMGFSYEDLLEIKNFGSKSADEVIEALERIGMTLRRTTPYLELFSPTARAVLFAYYCGGSKRLAAALRAAADQVVPETNGMFISPAELQQEKTRDQLLAIADELEAHG